MAVGTCGAYGFAYDFPREDAASRAALGKCTGGCRVVPVRHALGVGREHHHKFDISTDQAAKQLDNDGVSVEIIDLRTVLPWDKAAVLESVRKTSKLLVLHEDTHTGGFGAEIVASVAEEAFEDLDGPIRRITAPDCPVPFSPPLEKAYIPQVDDVVAGLRDLAAY